MFKKKGLWHGMSLALGVTLGVSVMAGNVLETFSGTIDTALGTRSEIIVSDDDGKLYSTFTPDADVMNADGTANSKKLIQKAINLNRKEAVEGSVLLKNKNKTLPIQATSGKPKVTLFGVRSHINLLGSGFGVKAQGPCITLEQALRDNRTDFAHTEATKTGWTGDEFDFDGAGFDLNPTMIAKYEELGPATKLTMNDGASEKYVDKEISREELGSAAIASIKDYSDYGIVVVGRAGGESHDYLPGGVADPSAAAEPLQLTVKEKEIINLAKETCKKVIVLVNCTSAMEIDELKDDDKIDSIMWIGFPGCYGMLGVADLLCGKQAPSGHLYDIYATRNMSAPAMQNMGNFTFANAADIERSKSKTYVVEAEGIYVGYRYYETRYYDAVYNQGNASSKKGAYASQGNWNYSDEVAYGFGYGESYTSFDQQIVSVTPQRSAHEIKMDVKVKVTNTGDVAAKDVVQIYAKAPWEKGMVEKSAVQLLGFEKTDVLKPNESKEITVTVDLQDLASYDSNYDAPNGKKGGYVFDNGDYYFAVGNGAHDALNNILAAEGKTTADGMDYDGVATDAYKWTYRFAGNGTDYTTFSTSKTNTQISNQLEYADWNYYNKEVTYLSRTDWDATWPKTYDNMVAPASMMDDLNGKYYTIKTSDDTSSIKWDSKSTDLKLYDLTLSAYDDYRWEDLLSQMSVEESMYIAGYGGPTIPAVKSIGLAEYYMTENCGNGMVLALANTKDPNAPWALNEDKNKQWNPQVFACSPVVASTFNHEFMYELGKFVGEEALFDGLPILWGPGLNTHRHAYNGRNCEYYSEDPILSGVCAMEFAIGAFEKGLIAAPKHFAFNDQETNRNGIAPFMTEQRAREVELRAFQMAFEANKYDVDGRDAGMRGLMTSFSKIGAVECTCSKGLLTDILRNEWGFKGYAVTDIFDDTDLYTAAVYAGITGFDIRGASNFYEKTTLASRFGKEVDGIAIAPGIYDGDLAMQQALKRSNHDFLWALTQSNLMNMFNGSTHVEKQMTWWRAAYIAAIATTATLTAAAAACYVITAIKTKED